MLKASVSNAAGKDLPAAQLHYLHFSCCSFKLWQDMVNARNSLNQQLQPKNWVLLVIENV